MILILPNNSAYDTSKLSSLQDIEAKNWIDEAIESGISEVITYREPINQINPKRIGYTHQGFYFEFENGEVSNIQEVNYGS